MRASHPLFVVVLLATSAHAQDVNPPPNPPAEPGEPEPTEVVAQPWSISAGFGVIDFTGSSAGDASDIGITYDIRVGYRLSRPFRLEGALFRSSQDIEALGLASDASIKSTGLEALARYDFVGITAFDVGGIEISPFVFGGLAWQNFSLSDEGVNTSDVADDDTTFAIPLGAGIGGASGRLNVDARFTWRQTFDDEMFSARLDGDVDSSLSQWALTARAGVAF